jgi:hypothetical protein
VRFELTVPVKVQRFSRPSRSTTLAPLRGTRGYSIGITKRKLVCRPPEERRGKPQECRPKDICRGIGQLIASPQLLSEACAQLNHEGASWRAPQDASTAIPDAPTCPLLAAKVQGSPRGPCFSTGRLSGRDTERCQGRQKLGRCGAIGQAVQAGADLENDVACF